jgi:hypothetical protein
MPRVQTSDEIAAELTAAGLNVAQPVHSGTQALLVAKIDTADETTGYFVRDIFPTPNTLDTASKVTVDFWSRPMDSGAGGDPTPGVPDGNDRTIGERLGNVFFGVSDTNDGGSGQRIAAVRFGVDTLPDQKPMYDGIAERHIDFATNISGVWVKSGLLWEPDQWYNFRFEIDFTTKTYDFFVNDEQANEEPIIFYHTAAEAARRFFVSRGTNQAGAILDDVSVMPFVEPPPTPGDFNMDGLVDGEDFLVWQRDPNIGSLDDWKTNYGASVNVAASAIPEPGAALLAMAMVGVGVTAGRGRRRG